MWAAAITVTAAIAAALVTLPAPRQSGADQLGQPMVAAAPRLVKQAAPPMPESCGSDGANCQRTLAVPGGYTVSALSNFPLTGDTNVRHAIVVIHGAGRNPRSTFTGMMQAASKAGVEGNTLVLAPWFKAPEDKPGDHEAVWSSGGWKVGDSAQQPSGLSSFQVMDDLVSTLADKSRFPHLAWITVVGHSAGGQFTDRYATFGLAPNDLRGVSFNFVVANPSSYVYFDNTRPSDSRTASPASSDSGEDTATTSSFEAPSSCADYNTYKYGMDGRSGYVAKLTAQQALANYLRHRVTILNGGADTFQNGDMDANCGAMLQGPNRETRGANFFLWIHTNYPSAPHDRIVVPGVDHNHYALFESPRAATVLFGPNTRAVGDTTTQ